MRHMLSGKNLGLVTARSNRSPDMDHFFCSRLPTETKCGESTIQSYLFPLYLMPDVSQEEKTLPLDLARRVNLSPYWLRNLERATATPTPSFFPEDSFHFIYAILHSPTYRTRYVDFLKTDFPRIPLPGSLAIFRDLIGFGAELVALHLLESPKVERFITEYLGGRAPEVERVSWSNNTVWLDKAQTTSFKGVRAEVWNFHVGGYQVCEKWLKYRKGRTLSRDDIAHYQKVVVALAETIRLMKAIDETIDRYGGWPGAFQTESPESATPPVVTLGNNVVRFPDPPPREEALAYPTKDAPRLHAAEPPAEAPREEEPGQAPRELSQDLGKIDLMALLRQCFGRGGPRDREAAIRDLCTAAGYERVGRRIRELADDAIRTAVRRGILSNEAGRVALATRSIEDYGRSQLKDQFLASLGGSRWTDRDEAVRQLARWLGFRRAGPAIDEAARSLINGLLREDRLEADGDAIRRRA
jgi:hypothetical protein